MVSARSFRQHAAHRDHVFGANLLGFLMGRRVDFRSKDDLTDAAAIAQIDEDHSAVIAPAVHPTDQGHLFADRMPRAARRSNNCASNRPTDR